MAFFELKETNGLMKTRLQEDLHFNDTFIKIITSFGWDPDYNETYTHKNLVLVYCLVSVVVGVAN